MNIVANTGVVREKGFHYFIQGGSVIKQDRKTKEKTVVAENAFTPEKGFFYFLDGDGNVQKTVRASKKKVEVVEVVA